MADLSLAALVFGLRGVPGGGDKGCGDTVLVDLFCLRWGVYWRAC